MELNIDTLTFGKYKNKTLSVMLKDLIVNGFFNRTNYELNMNIYIIKLKSFSLVFTFFQQILSNLKILLRDIYTLI